MQRDMSYALDGTFAGRNGGQLVTRQQVVTTTKRIAGVTPRSGNGVPNSGFFLGDDPSAAEQLTSALTSAAGAISPLITPQGQTSTPAAAPTYTTPPPAAQSSGIMAFLTKPLTSSFPVVGAVTPLKIGAGVLVAFLVMKLLRK
jgi:hypothetical protein